VHRFIVALGIVLAFSAYAQRVGRAAPDSCESLRSLTLTNAQITFAGVVAAGTFAPPSPLPTVGPAAAPALEQLPSFCRVAARLTPSTDSDIKIEISMPSRSGTTGS